MQYKYFEDRYMSTFDEIGHLDEQSQEFAIEKIVAIEVRVVAYRVCGGASRNILETIQFRIDVCGQRE